MSEPADTPQATTRHLPKLLDGPIAALGVAIAVYVISPEADPSVGRMAAIATWLAPWWVTEAIPTPVTALLAKAGKALGTDPRVLMTPATLPASCAFMTPVASPTQAIVFGSGFWALASPAMGIDPAVVPKWAQ